MYTVIIISNSQSTTVSFMVKSTVSLYVALQKDKRMVCAGFVSILLWDWAAAHC